MPDSAVRPAGRRAWVVVVVCLLSALYLWLALRSADLVALRRAIAQLSVPLIPVLLAAALATLWVRARRIALSLVRKPPVSTAQAARSMMAGYVTSLLLPQPAGELARLTVATRDLGVSPAAATASIAIERVLDLLLALLLVAAVTPFAPHTDPRLLGATRVLSALAALGCIALALAMGAPAACRALFEPIFALLPQHAAAWCRHHFDDLLRSLGQLSSAHRMLRYCLLSLAQTALWGCCIGVSLYAAGIAPGAVAVILTTALFTLALLLPSAPGYIGSLQLAYVAALVPLGVATPQAIAASLYLHVLFNALLIALGLAVFGRHWLSRRLDDGQQQGSGQEQHDQ